MSRVHVCISITEFYEEIDDDGNSEIHESYWNNYRDLGVFENLAEAQKFIKQCLEHRVNLYGCSGRHEIEEGTSHSWIVEMNDGYGSYANIDFCEVD